MERIVGIGEYIISNNESDVIKTYALASCVAVTAYSPFKKTAGMIHLALPTPLDPNDRLIRPYYFVTTGLPLFLKKMTEIYGCSSRELIIGVYGGANSIKDEDVFRIGYKNVTAVKDILQGLSLGIKTIKIGGTVSRTLEMNVASGLVKVTTQPIKI